jgi:hypothetical protein
MICTETWPRPFLEVPLSLVRDEDIPLEFTVWIDGTRARGRWQFYEYDPPDVEDEKAERAFYFWQWDEQPIPLRLRRRSGTSLVDFIESIIARGESAQGGKQSLRASRSTRKIG